MSSLILSLERVPDEVYQSTSWEIVYWDDRALVCLRNAPENRELIQKFECGLSSPGVIGDQFLAHSNLPEIGRQLRRKVQDDPSCIVALRNLGRYYIEMDQFRDAIEHLRQAIELQPRSWDALFHLGYGLYKSKQYAAALPHYRQAIALRGSHAISAYSLGLCYRKLDQLPEALRAVRRAVALDPGFVHAWCELADILLALGRRDEAIAQLERGAAMTGKRELRKRLGEVIRRGGSTPGR